MTSPDPRRHFLSEKTVAECIAASRELVANSRELLDSLRR